MEQPVHWSRHSPRIAIAVGCLLVVWLCATFALAGRGPVKVHSADEMIGRIAVANMRAGDGYYPAMDKALRATNGPPKTARDFRQPLVFEFWRALPSEDAIWLAFVVLAGLAGLALAATAEPPLVAPLVVFYMLKAASFDQHLLVEMWAAPLLLLAIASWRHGWYRAAAVCATAAVLVRELSVLLAVGGLLSRRRDPRPWAIALAVAVVGVLAHFAFAGHYASSRGTEAPLLGTGGLTSMFDMAGVGFHDRTVAGLALWTIAWLRVRADRELALFSGPLLALPLLGLLADREYWGFVVVPTILLFVLEAPWVLFAGMRRSSDVTAGHDVGEAG